MKQAFGLRWEYGATNPGRMPRAGMKQAFGLKATAPSPALRSGFTAEPASGKNASGEGNGFISGGEPLAYHPKMGRYADLHNYLLGR
jgi:hypothetical protein